MREVHPSAKDRRATVISALVNRDRVDHDRLYRPVAAAGAHGADLVHDVAAGLVGDLSEDRVFALKVRGWARGDEELRTVGALAASHARVGHGHHVRLAEVLVRADLVIERVAGAAHTA